MNSPIVAVARIPGRNQSHAFTCLGLLLFPPASATVFFWRANLAFWAVRHGFENEWFAHQPKSSSERGGGALLLVISRADVVFLHDSSFLINPLRAHV